MRTFRIIVLALTVAHPVPAQLREVRPARSAFAFGWSDVTGYGTAVAFIERLWRVPLALGIAAGGGGAGAHLQVHLPNPFTPPPPDHEAVTYLSGGITRLFGRNGQGEAKVEWAAASRTSRTKTCVRAPPATLKSSRSPSIPRSCRSTTCSTSSSRSTTRPRSTVRAGTSGRSTGRRSSITRRSRRP